MTFNEYQEGACSTEHTPDDDVRSRFKECRRVLTVMMGVPSPPVEWADDLKRYIFYGKPSGTVTNLISTYSKLLSNQMVPDTDDSIRMVHGWLGIVSEIPELAAAIMFQDNVNIAEESGDIKWYGAILDSANGVDGDAVAEANYKKLQARRTKDGAVADIANRDLDEERALLQLHCP